MKTILAIIAVVMSFGITLEAKTHIKKGVLACLSEKWLNEIHTLYAQKDKQGVNYMLRKKQCLITSGRFPASVLDRGWTKSKLRVYVDGNAVTVWTPNESIGK